MTDKLKSKIASRFLPKSTYTAPAATAANLSGTTNMKTRPSSSMPTPTPRDSNGALSTLRGQPIIMHEGSRRNAQTLESEKARDELLKHGITVRDFQVEADARKYGDIASLGMAARQQDWQAFERSGGSVDRSN
ncbi:uncharacterized protein A1O9_10016 [Exophiala aquamarina CBS 119918]|uniref:Uncharacterized protein n=1 Tax=Exophiala aquamarina CBS 119918 TaxID=1182545 RepID=A0A072PF83_9EURO|nr:uncharacterized protein A1O9_10016 [Exophiala aquamarina CBS 119918]KEF54220.1 hypothetical protein A1O9_10016 [Exophiala aquamarina CBS 119918]